MTDKDIISNDYRDKKTGLRFVEDDRGNYHMVPDNTTIVNPPTSEPQEVIVKVEIPPQDEDSIKKAKRYYRIMERMRAENVWLWEWVSKTIRDKKTPQRAIERLEKAVKDRQRMEITNDK